MTNGIQLNTNYMLSFFDYKNVSDWMKSSFGIKLLRTLYLETILAMVLGITIFYLGMDMFLHNIAKYVFAPPLVFLLPLIVIGFDTLAGAYRGFKTTEGFQTKRAVRLLPKLVTNALFLYLFSLILKHMVLELDHELLINFNISLFAKITNIIKIIVALALTGIHGISCMKNLSQIGLMPKSFVKWFEAKVDKYKDKVDKIV
jgi:hypothetical protein